MAKLNRISNYDDYQLCDYFPELDGIRAIAVLMVISFHIKGGVGVWLSGDLGVQIFFVLSGYLITMLAIREERSRGALNLRAFYVRRFFRLFPLYYFVLATYCVLIFGLGVAPQKRELLARGLPYYLIYFQEWPFFLGVHDTHQLVPFGHTWTLGIEEKFYLVWPLLAFALGKNFVRLRFPATAALAILTAISPVLDAKLGRFVQPYTHILIGCGTALLLENRSTYNKLAGLVRSPIPPLVIAAFLGLQLTLAQVSWEWDQALRVAYSFVVAMVLVLILLKNGPVQRWLQRPSLVAIGRLSYGMYLIQFLALNVVEKMIPSNTGSLAVSLSSLLLTVVLTLAGAQLLALTIERPGRIIGRRLSQSLQRLPSTREPEAGLTAG